MGKKKKSNQRRPIRLLFRFVMVVLVLWGASYLYKPKPTLHYTQVVLSHPVMRRVGGRVWREMDKAWHFLVATWQSHGPSGGYDAEAPKRAADSVRVASFNIRILSDKSRDDDELSAIATVISRYDVIAIQEVRDETVMRRLVRVLRKQGHRYKYIISPPVGAHVKERYVFLWHEDMASLVGSGTVYADTQDVFIREPYIATFKAGNFDFTLITVHVLFGKSKAERRPEIVALARVFLEIQAANPDEQDVLLLGDFNFSADDIGFRELLDTPSMTYVINPTTKTTIGDKSSYDNLFFEKRYVREFDNKASVYAFDVDMFQRDYDKAKLAVSDHRPIWAVFKTTLPDDD